MIDIVSASSDDLADLRRSVRLTLRDKIATDLTEGTHPLTTDAKTLAVCVTIIVQLSAETASREAPEHGTHRPERLGVTCSDD